jgi:hypothetical protein
MSATDSLTERDPEQAEIRNLKGQVERQFRNTLQLLQEKTYLHYPAQQQAHNI